MDKSVVSYRSKYASESRRNYNTNTLQQQQQIQELQQKVDLILLHNNQLIEQNQKLKAMLSRQAQIKYKSSDSQLYILRRQLDRKCLELEALTKQTIAEKEVITNQLDDLNQIIRNLTVSRQTVIYEKQQLQRKLDKYSLQKNSQLNHLKQELENQIYQNSLKKQIQHKEQMREKQMSLNRKFQKKMQQWQDERTRMEQQKMNTILGMEEKMQKQKEQIKKAIQAHFHQKLQQIQNESDQKCRKVRDQSENYIKIMIQQQREQRQEPQLQLKKQIQILKSSLQQRQKVIQNLLKFQTSSSIGTPSYYKQCQDLRQRIKQLTESFFKQSELLKLKMASQHQVDINETVKVYDNKIQILSFRIAMLQQDKLRLRESYQQEIRAKMKQRQRFQIQVSKLKNYIRKMKVQLQSYGKQMRLNIQGIRDQANSFSMSILGQLGQEKNKKNFYQQQNRKLREVVNLKDNQMEVATKQNQQKITYYEQMLKSARHSIQELSQQLYNKQQKFKEEIDLLKQNAKDQLKKQRQHWHEQSEQFKRQISSLTKQKDGLQQNLKEVQAYKVAAEKQLEKVRHDLQECKAHIEELKLQMQMAGQQSAQQQRNALKQHYQRVIDQLQQDKQILKQTNSAQSEQLSKLIHKYKILESSMQKTLSTMKKKSELQKRVMQLGMDNNLVKNLSQVFRKSQDKQNI